MVLLEVREGSIQQQSLPDLQPSAVAEYAQLRMQLEYTSNMAIADLPSPANLFRDKSLGRLTPGSASFNAMLSRMSQLERNLYGGERPALRPQADPRLQDAVAALAQFEINKLQTSVVRVAQQVSLLLLLQLCIARLAGLQGSCVHRYWHRCCVEK